MDVPNVLFWVVADHLGTSDEKVYVELPGGERLPVAGWSSGQVLAEALADAVNEHSLTTADVVSQE